MGNRNSSKVYHLWLRTSDEEEVVDPWWYSRRIESYNNKQLKRIVEGKIVTHLKVKGSLPLAHEAITAGLQQLAIKQLPEDEKDLKSLKGCVNLEKLIIGSNKFPAGFPEVIVSLISLKELDFWDSALHTLPDSLQSLENLRILDIRWNLFETLPPVILRLRCLEILNLEGCKKLTRLEKGLVNLENLKKLDCTGCESLCSPPKSVCYQGFKAVKQFYKNLAEGRRKHKPVTTIAVIGKSFAGKTSLIKTLQRQDFRRILTNRAPGDKEGATKVFELRPVVLVDSRLNFIDFGGNDIYHICYQLTVRENCIPLIVVNIKQYDDLCGEVGKKEATRQVGLDWISHLYLSCPGLGPPILVFTHKDCFSSQTFLQLKNQFLKVSEELRQELLLEEKQLDGTHQTISHLANTSKRLFILNNVFDVGNGVCYEVFSDIKAALNIRSLEYMVELPEQWMCISESLQSSAEVLMNLSDLYKEHLDKSMLHIVLRHLHNCGEILWFENLPPPLSNCVFHKISNVTEMLSVIFNHQNDELWDTRLQTYDLIKLPDGRTIESEEFKSLVKQFQTSGVMPKVILSHLLKSESPFASDDLVSIAIEILKSFRLIHGPVSNADDVGFVFPYFVTKTCTESVGDYSVTLQTNVKFKGLALPRYVYQQMSVALLQLHPAETASSAVCQKGAVVWHGHTCSTLTYDYNSRTVILRVRTNTEHICSAWKQMVELVQTIVSQTSQIWKATRYVCCSICAHCLLKQSESPEERYCSRWCDNQHLRSTADAYLYPCVTYYQGVEPVRCNGDTDVPKPLKFPCEGLTSTELAEVKKYVSAIRESGMSLSDAQSEGSGEIFRSANKCEHCSSSVVQCADRVKECDEMTTTLSQPHDNDNDLSLCINSLVEYRDRPLSQAESLSIGPILANHNPGG